MNVFVEGNHVDILQFINGAKDSIKFMERKLRINLDVVKDKVKVIEEMYRIMCDQERIINELRETLVSKTSSVLRNDETELNSKSVIESLKRNVKVAEEEYANIKLKYDSLVDQVRELRSLNLDKAEKNINLEVEKKKLYDELQKEKAINRRLRNTIKNLVEGDDVGKKYSAPTFDEDIHIPSDRIIPREVIAGIAFERPNCL